MTKRALHQTTIRIDLEVYKALEARRESFKETHSAILKRILEEIDEKLIAPPVNVQLTLPCDGDQK